MNKLKIRRTVLPITPSYLCAVLGSASCLVAAPVFAQDTNSTLESDPPTEVILVTADPIGLLEERPTDSILGINRTALETPRSMSIISDETIERYSIEDLDDFITTTPGTYGGSFFGVPGSISIRGSISETYFRGFRRALNQGLFPTPVGAAERVEILRGPPPAIYGASRIGGFLNFQPKSTLSEGLTSKDDITGQVTYTGGSYNKNKATAELQTPFLIAGREAGLSLYGEYEDSDDFYKIRHPKHQLFQFDFNHDLGNDWSIVAGGMYYKSEGYVQTIGWNRLTQELIDNGTYITGIDTDVQDLNGDGQLQSSEITAGFDGADSRPLIDFGVPDVYTDAFELDTGVGTTKLDERTVYGGAGELQDSDSFTSYADLSKEMEDGSTFKFQLFSDAVDGKLNTVHGFAAEHVMDVTEARTSYEFELDFTDDLYVSSHISASYRDYDFELREHFLSQGALFDRLDLSIGSQGNDVIATPLTDASILWDTDINGNWTDIGLGLIADIHYGENFSLLLGLRYDDYEAESEDNGQVVYSASSGTGSASDTSYSASLSYNFEDVIIPYITVAETSEPLYNSNGGINAHAVGDDFLFDSELIEIGVKFSLLDSSFNGSIAYYEQERYKVDSYGNVNQETGSGLEAELRYLINDNVSLTGAATFQEFLIGAVGECGSYNGAFLNIPANHPTTVNASGEELTIVTGSGGSFSALNASCLPELQDGYKRKQIPDTVLSSFLTYTSDRGANDTVYGGTFGATYVSETSGSLETAVTFPAYTVFRAAAFVDIGRFNLTATVDNLFDERYFQPLQDINADTSALPGKGRTFQLTGKINF
jgi:iron complex outermembrane receptor protein